MRDPQEPTIKDPKVEETENQVKNNLEAVRVSQLELIQLGADKKRVTQEIVDLNTAHEAKINDAEAESKQKLNEVITDTDKKAEEKKALETEIEELKKVKDTLVIENQPLIDENKKQIEFHSNMKTTIETSLVEKSDLEKEIVSLKNDVANLTSTKNNLTTDIAVHTSTKESLEDKIKIHNNRLDLIEESRINTDSAKRKLEKDVENLTSTINTKTGQLKDIQTPLADLKKEVADLQDTKDYILKEINDKKVANDQEIDEKKTALMTIDTRVNEELRILKEYRAQFSAEELVKVKIKSVLD